MAGVNFWHAGSLLLYSGEDFNALDTVDSEVAFQVHAQLEHFSGVAGFLSNDGEHQCMKVNRWSGRCGRCGCRSGSRHNRGRGNWGSHWCGNDHGCGGCSNWCGRWYGDRRYGCSSDNWAWRSHVGGCSHLSGWRRASSQVCQYSDAGFHRVQIGRVRLRHGLLERGVCLRVLTLSFLPSAQPSGA